MFDHAPVMIGLPAGEDPVEVLPKDLEEIPAGPFLAAILSAVDRSRLGGHDRVRALQADGRMEAYFAARKLESVAAVVDVMEVEEFAATEVAAALNLTRRASDAMTDLALRLRDRLPAVLRLLREGTIDVARARVMVHATDHLAPEVAAHVVERVLDAASALTTGQLRARIRRLAVEVDAEDARRRYQDALTERHVVFDTTDSGTVDLHVYGLRADRGAALRRRLNQHVLDLKRTGDTRTVDQMRVDVIADVLAGLGPAMERPARVDIVVDLETLCGLAERAGEIGGVGPVVSDIARQVALDQPEARWTWAVDDGDGHLVATGVTRRRPTGTMARRVRARHRTCVHPGCRMPAIECDIDHTVAHAEGGPTTDCNLAPLCRFHHRAKDEGGWKMIRLSETVFEHVSPLGHRYVTSGRSP